MTRGFRRAPLGGLRFPSALTTGPAAGGYGALTVSAGGTIPAAAPYPSYVQQLSGGALLVEGYKFTSTIDLAASNITFRGCQFAPTGGYYCVNPVSGPSSAAFEFCEFSAATQGQILNYGVGAIAGMTIRWCDFHWIAEQPVASGFSGLIVDSCYFHDYTPTPTGHSECVYIGGTGATGSMSGVRITNNTMLAGSAVNNTSVIFFYSANYSFADIAIEGNLLAGGNYALQLASSSITGLTVAGNYFSTRFYSQCGEYGPLTVAPTWGSNGNTWSGNYWYDGPSMGALIAAP